MEELAATDQGKDVVVAYLDAIDVTETTRSGYERAFRQYLLYLKQIGKRVDTATRTDFMAYRDYLLTEHKPGTVQTYLVPVKTFYKYTAAAGIYPNITEGVKSPKRAQGFKKDSLTHSQCKDVLDGMKDKEGLRAARDFALVNLLARTGLRVIEAARADIGDLRTISGKQVLLVQGKGHSEKDDFVVLMPDAYKPIQDYLTFRGETDGNAPLFVSLANKNKGERMTTRSISRICKCAFREAGLDSERISAHSLRHTAVTAALLNGATVQEAQAMARHSNINTTMIYAHNIERLENPAEAKAGAFFE